MRRRSGSWPAQAIFAARPPARISDDPDWFECRLCPPHDTCHGDRLSERTCRSCMHVTPTADGAWHCARFDRLLSADQQRTGCGSHLFIPDAALQEGSMVDGSLARFLVFQTDHDVPDRNKRPKPVGDVPAELIEALREIVTGVPGHARGNIAALVEGPMIVPDPYPVPVAPDAEQLFDALDEELTAHQREAIGTNRSAVLARVWENTAKVALIKAVSANPAAPVIRLDDTEWARVVVDRCVTTMITEAERHIAENKTQAYHQKVLRLIQGAGSRGVSRNEITRRTQFLERKQREDILSALVEAGQIELGIETTAGRQAAIYRAAEQ